MPLSLKKSQIIAVSHQQEKAPSITTFKEEKHIHFKKNPCYGKRTILCNTVHACWSIDETAFTGNKYHFVTGKLERFQII